VGGGGTSFLSWSRRSPLRNGVKKGTGLGQDDFFWGGVGLGSHNLFARAGLKP
jgi:hypothetical protein